MNAAADRAVGSAVRWRVLALLVGFSAISYIERINLSVAGRFIRDELGMTDVQLGWTFSAFLIAYTLGQLPSGMLADRIGPRRLLAAAAIAWFVLTVLIVAGLLVPGISAAAAVAWIVALRFLLGLAEAPTYPAATRVVANWFPARERATANAVVQAASYAGSALTLPLMAAAVVAWGWKAAMFVSAAPALLIGVLWWRYVTDRPAEHRGVSSAELETIGAADQVARRPDDTASALRAALDPRALWLSASYFCQGYVLYLFFFWFYTYLVEARGFSVAGSGWIAALPTVAAAIAAFAGGPISDRLTARGAQRGRRQLLLWSGIVGGLCLLAGAFAPGAILAIAGFTLAIATRGFVEASYWTLAIEVNPAHAGTVGGAMNTASNLGGAVSTALAPVLVATFGWPIAIGVAAGLTALSGVLIVGMEQRATSVSALAGEPR